MTAPLYNRSMPLLVLAFAVSLCVTLLVIRSRHVVPRLLDYDVSGPQKFHSRPVPRIGGLGIVVGLCAVVLVLSWTNDEMAPAALLLLLCGAPAFAAGIAEDITKRISPGIRLAAAGFSALLAVWLLNAMITKTDIPGLDWVASTAIGAAALTVFAVAGIANSINIIDGFNGLASMCSVIMMMAIAYVAFQVDDQLVGVLALAGIGAVLGFFVWNFPAGLIFLGDGGAYFLGFFIAELSILLLARNRDVSPLFPLVVCVYPVFETLFSIYRRRFLRAVPPSMPDGIHLHSLIYRRIMRWAQGRRGGTLALTRRNSMTSPYLWLLCMMSVIPAVLFWRNSAILATCLLLFAVSYVILYWRIVRFRSPRWLTRSASRARMRRSADNRFQ